MPDIYDVVEPYELTGYARAALEDQAENDITTLERWLPNDSSPELTYRIEQGVEGLLDAAEFRAFDAEPTTGRREGTARMEGSLPPLGTQFLLGEFDQLMARSADDESVRNSLLRDAERCATNLRRRMEIARAEVLFTGKVTMRESGVKIDVDFGRRPQNTKALSVDLTDPDAAILDEFLDILQEYRDINGQAPGAFLLNERLIRAFVLNNEVRRFILGPNAATAQRVRRPDVLGFLADEGFPPFYVNEARATRKVYAADGATEGRVTGRITPEDTIAILPAPGAANVGGEAEVGQLGTTLWGAPLESRLPEYGVQGDEAGIVVASFIHRATPVHVNTVASAIGLPVVINPNATMSLKVK